RYPMKQRRCPKCSKMMDLVQTARGQVYSCTCGKLIQVVKKEPEVAELEEEPKPTPQRDEAKEHRRRLREARAEYIHKRRTVWHMLEEHLIFVVLGALLLWVGLTLFMFFVW